MRAFIEYDLRIRRPMLDCHSYRVLDVQRRVSETAVCVVGIAAKDFPRPQTRSLEKGTHNSSNTLRASIGGLIKD